MWRLNIKKIGIFNVCSFLKNLPKNKTLFVGYIIVENFKLYNLDKFSLWARQFKNSLKVGIFKFYHESLLKTRITWKVILINLNSEHIWTHRYRIIQKPILEWRIDFNLTIRVYLKKFNYLAPKFSFFWYF